MVQFDKFVSEYKKKFSEELGWFVLKSQSIREDYTNQILFLVSPSQLEKTRMQIQRGVISLDTELVSLLRKDLREWKVLQLQKKLKRGLTNKIINSNFALKTIVQTLET